MTTFRLNGRDVTVGGPGDAPLLWAIRDDAGLTGTKFGCGIGQCGACTVHVNGEAVRSCLTPVSSVAGKAVTTIEGLGGNMRFRRPGSRPRPPSAATASRARSCRPPPC